MKCFAAIAVLFFSSGMVSGADNLPRFEAKTIDPHVGNVCYAVTLADVDGDRKQDIVAVSENRVVWYRNPTWIATTILEDQTPRDNVCIAAHDIDGDGKIDFALGAGWTKIGTLHWISRGKSAGDKWQVHSIGGERWLHRARWADVLGKGRPQLVISPLNATVGAGVQLTAFEIPKDPAKDRWQPIVMNRELNQMHNHWHADLDDDGKIDTLTASQEGIHLIRRSAQGWTSTRIGTGIETGDPKKRGAGEIKLGHLKGGKPFIVTIEPMHGHQLAIYFPQGKLDAPWKRTLIDEGFQRGHALAAADLDGDGGDEIIFGDSDTPQTHGVRVYSRREGEGESWNKASIDVGGIATEDLVVGDLTGDGRPDIVVGGRATHNVKLYVNAAQ